MTEDVGAGGASGDPETGNADGGVSAAGDVAGRGAAGIGAGGGVGGGGIVPLGVEWASVMPVLLTVRVMYRWRCRGGVAGGAVGGGVTSGANGDGAAGRVDCEGCCSSGAGAGVRCCWCGGPGGGEARGAVVGVAGDAVGDGGAAGGVSGCAVLGDGGGEGVACGGPGDVGDGDGERAMMMLVMPIRWVLYGMQRVVAVGNAPGGGGAGGLMVEGHDVLQASELWHPGWTSLKLPRRMVVRVLK